jgi:hypothetical protein
LTVVCFDFKAVEHAAIRGSSTHRLSDQSICKPAHWKISTSVHQGQLKPFLAEGVPDGLGYPLDFWAAYHRLIYQGYFCALFPKSAIPRVSRSG